MDNIAFIVTCMCCIQRLHCTKNPPPGDAVSQPEDGLGDWYAVTGDVMRKCAFPVAYEGGSYDYCLSTFSVLFGKYEHPWCATVEPYVRGRDTGVCSKVIQRNPSPEVDGTYSYNDTTSSACAVDVGFAQTSFFAIFYFQLKTSRNCQIYCGGLVTCKGIIFIKSKKWCFIEIERGLTYDFSGVTEYTRYICNTSIIIKPPTKTSVVDTNSALQSKSKHKCIDTFTVRINTTASGGSYMENVTTLESCKQLCLYYDTRDNKHLCIGFRYDETEESLKKCFLHNNAREFNITNTAVRIHLYARHACIFKGYYYYNINGG